MSIELHSVLGLITAFTSFCFCFFFRLWWEKNWEKIRVSTQFSLCCHASVVSLQQNNEKLKGKSFDSPSSSHENFIGRYTSPAFPSAAGMIGRTGKTELEKKWEKKKNLGVCGIDCGVVCVEFPPFYCVFFLFLFYKNLDCLQVTLCSACRPPHFHEAIVSRQYLA